MSEPIHWQQLTPAQRDELIHEKVMMHTYSIVPHGVLSRAGGIAFTHDVKVWHIDSQEVPRYTQSMDAAWNALLVTGFGGKYTGKSDIRVLARELLGTNDHDLDPFYILGFVSAWTPESICIACLRSCGCEVISEK